MASKASARGSVDVAICDWRLNPGSPTSHNDTGSDFSKLNQGTLDPFDQMTGSTQVSPHPVAQGL